MKRMPIDALLSRLSKHHIKLAEDRRFPDGSRVLIFVTHLPSFPFGRSNVWYTLVISPGQDDISKSEVDALLRHVWHAELDFFENDNPFENEDSPTSEGS
jgi:hypothetical protein